MTKLRLQGQCVQGSSRRRLEGLACSHQGY